MAHGHGSTERPREREAEMTLGERMAGEVPKIR